MASARTSDPETSHTAAAVIGRCNMFDTYVKIITFLQEGRTDEELRSIFPEHREASNSRLRRHELHDVTYVEECGRRLNSGGSMMTIWRATIRPEEFTDAEYAVVRAMVVARNKKRKLASQPTEV